MSTSGVSQPGPRSNFGFLRADWPGLFEEARRAEHLALLDPRTSCFYARRTLEQFVDWLYTADRTLRQPYKDTLDVRLHEPTFKNLVGHTILTKANLIRRQGNTAVHGKRRIDAEQSRGAVRELFHVMYWLGSRYARTEASRPPAALAFDAELLPRRQVGAPAVQSQAQLRQLEERLGARDEQLAAERARSAGYDAQIAELQAEIAAAKAARAATPDTHDYDEAQTRGNLIDVLLAEAGWTLTAENREYPVTGMPTKDGENNGTGRVDYVLWGDDGKPLAVIEAKRTSRDARAGEQQATLYADCLERQFGQRPLIYYTNGFEHWFWDDTRDPPRPVQGFHTRDELALSVQRRTSRRSLAGATVNSAIVERHYQQRAIRRITETFEQRNERRALVVMATGAGKTRTVIALVELLMRCNWAKRVLFLADRLALVDQAVKAFSTHLPDSAPVNLVTEKQAEGRVYVSTYPTMMGLIDAPGDGERRFGIGYFDLVIVDEAHRSIYQKYGALFAYFDARLVGLTATPRDDIDRNTYNLFHIENGVPTDAYPLDEAIGDGYLVPPRSYSYSLGFQREGIRYDELTEEEKEQWELLDWNDEGEIPTEVPAESVNKWLFNTDTVDKVLHTLMTQGVMVAGGDRLGKTIIFATNRHHADFIVERFNANYPERRGSFARAVTYQADYVRNIINDFSVKEKAPHIAVSVDMLDTGIDIPEVANLVFFKILRSKTKFWQMVGRGTRRCAELFGPGQDKTEFRVFDFCGNLEFFSANPDTPDGAAAPSLGQRLFTSRLALLGGLDTRLARGGSGDRVTAAERDLRRDIADLLHGIVAGMNADNVVVRPHLRQVRTYAVRAAWDELDDTARDEIGEHLSDLPSRVRDEDELAKRFDLLMLRAQLCVLNAEPGFTRIRDRVREIADGLLEQTNIPAIRERQVFLEALAEQSWWADVTVSMLEQARRTVRSLVRLLARRSRKTVYTDFVDNLGEAAEIDMIGASAPVDMARFRAKVREFLRRHEDHIALYKLRRNAELTAADLAELQRMLTESGELDADTLKQAAEQAEGLGLFVRSLVGLHREAAVAALSEFLNDTTLCANQIEFLNMVVEHLTRNGAMTPEQLYEPPFTDIAPRGPEAFFPTNQLGELTAVLNHVRDRATTAS